MSCKNTEETALVYGPSHINDTVALTKCIDNISRCSLYCYPTHFTLKGRETGLSPPVNISLTVPRWCFFCGSFLLVIRGVPAYTQSTQLRTLIFECPKNKNVLNREKCNKNMPHTG